MDRMGILFYLLVTIVDWNITSADDNYDVYDTDTGCSQPSQFENAYVMDGEYYFEYHLSGTTVEYRCHEGYESVNSGPLVRTCTNKQWTGSDVICKAIPGRKCSKPPDVVNAYLQRKYAFKKTFNHQTTVRYGCKAGMVLTGGALKVTCQDGHWSDVKFRCKLGSCGRLSDPEHGQRRDRNQNPGQYTHFRCYPGYNLKGPSRLFCRSDLKWLPSDPPTCEPKQCPPIEDFRHGSVFQESLDGKRNDYGSVVEYTCHHPYILRDGQRTRRCNEDGAWEGTEPRCYLPKCPPIQRPLYNGQIEYSHRDLTMDSSAFFLCNEGADLFPEDKIEAMCLETGMWDMEESDMPECLEHTSVPVVENGGVFDYQSRRRISAQTNIKHGRSVFVQCNRRYAGFRDDEFLDSTPQYVSRSQNGSWYPAIAQCRHDLCSFRRELTHPANRFVGDVFGIEVLSRDVIFCKDDYEVAYGKKTLSRNCYFGKINIPNCKLKHCDHPEDSGMLYFQIGHNTPVQQDEPIRSRSQIKMTCHVGYNLYVDDRQSQSTSVINKCHKGNWEKRVRCKQEICSVGRLPSHMVSDKENVQSGTQVKLSCSDGYEINNRGRRQENIDLYCHGTTLEDKNDLNCVEKRCRLDDNQNVVYGTSERMVSSGDVVKITCKGNYEIYSPGRRKFTGTESEVMECRRGDFRKQFTCKEARCVTPDGWYRNGILKKKGREVKDIFTRSERTVDLSCDDGFYVVPNHPQVECKRGSWTPVFPKCLPHQDLNTTGVDLTAIQSGCVLPEGYTAYTDEGYTFNGGDTIPTLDVALVECLDSMYTGTAIILCMESGEFNATLSSCTEEGSKTSSTGCVLPEEYTAFTDEGVASGGDMIPLLEIISVECKDSLYIQSDYLMCMENGEFNTTLPPCTGSTEECPELSNGKVIASINNTYELKCIDGYTLSSVDCLATQCKDKMFLCGEARCLEMCAVPYTNDTMNGRFVPSSDILSDVMVDGTTVTVTCDEGFEPEVVTFRCKDGDLRSNVTDFRVTDGYFPRCKEAYCETCGEHGDCVRNNKCRCHPGYYGKGCNRAECPRECEDQGHSCDEPNICTCPAGRSGTFCDKVDCPLACESNGGWCESPNICQCPPDRTGYSCETVYCPLGCEINGGRCEKPNICQCPPDRTGYRCETVRATKTTYLVNMKIKDELLAGTLASLKLTVTGKKGRFARDLNDDIDHHNSFDSGLKLRYKWDNEYDVGEITGITISLSWPTNLDTLSLEFVSIYSYSQDTFHRFTMRPGSHVDLVGKFSRQCSFTTFQNAYLTFAWNENRMTLGRTHSAKECQFRCVENPVCKVAQLDKRGRQGYCGGSNYNDRIITGNKHTKFEAYEPSCN